jgi:acetyl-CoA carboxylase biotin carboxyl carrier protein
MTMDINEIKELLKLIKRYGVDDFSLQRGEDKLRIRKGQLMAAPAVVETRPAAAPDVPAAPASAPVAPAPASAEPTDTLSVGENQFLVTSPIVGTFYRAPSPESPPYVEPGTQVGKGAVLCIVEAMKIMNEIESEVSGKVSSILVENAQPVEYGQPLFIVDLS